MITLSKNIKKIADNFNFCASKTSDAFQKHAQFVIV